MSQLVTIMRNFEAREDERWYSIRALDVFAASDTSFLREGPIIASRLVSLTLTANVIKAKTQQQLAALATKLVTPHLNELKILRPVPSAKDYERSMLQLFVLHAHIRYLSSSITDPVWSTLCNISQFTS